MSSYLLVESRDPFECRDCLWLYQTAKSLGTSGNHVTLFLIQNGVFPAVAGSAFSRHLTILSAASIQVFADTLSLQERSIGETQLIDEVEPVTIDTLADLLVKPGMKAMWH